MGHKSSLKAALHSQQSRLQKKQKAAHAAQISEQKQKGKRSKGKEKAQPPRVTIPFRPTDKILLIGEGNFSFARALVVDPPKELEHLPPENITATAYDTEDECFEKYADAEEIVRNLRERGVEVIFDVDATKITKTSALKGRKWDKIVWNFPHAGKGIADQDRNILSNQTLILRFLRSAATCLSSGPIPPVAPGKRKRKVDDEDDEASDDNDNEGDIKGSSKTRGIVLVTLRNVPPYTLWDIPRLAKKPPSYDGKTNPPFTLLRSFIFHRHVWKGYEHRMTKGERAHGQGKTGEGGEDRTWEFCLRD